MKLAVKYSEEEDYLQFSLSKLKKEFQPVIDFAYDKVKAPSPKNLPEQERIIPFIKCLPPPSQRIHYFKRMELTQEAFKLMVFKKMYSDTYRYARAQQMYSEGIELALKLNDKQMISEIILDKAVSDLYNSKNICTDDLEEIAKSHSEAGAKACLLLAKFEFCAANIVDAEKDCFRSFELYQKIKIKVGQIEAFNLLIRVLRVKGEIKSNIIPCLTVEAVDRINGIEKTIEKSSESPLLTYNLNTILRFYGIEPKGKYYHMACDQDIWIKKLQSENRDDDGMIQLSVQHTQRVIIKHLRNYKRDWIEFSKCYTDKLLNRLQLSFSFHKQLATCGYIQQSLSSFLGRTQHITDYFSLCELCLQVSELDTESQEHKTLYNEIKTAILKLLTPISQLYIPITKKEQFGIIGDEKSRLYKLLKSKTDEVMARKDFKATTVDEWLLVWRILSIFGSNRVNMIHAHLKKVVDNFDEWSYEFVYDKKKESHVHYFTNWIWSCELLHKTNEVLFGIRYSLHFFIAVIARRYSLQTISIQNLVNILSTYATALLAMISCSYTEWDLEQHIYIPQSMQSMFNVYDDLNCQEQKLLVCCYNTVKTVTPHKALNDSFNMLFFILDIIMDII